MRSETLKGHLDLLLLAVLRHRPAHGYAVVEELKKMSDGTFDLPEGTIYPALHRLERAGLLSSRWADSVETGRPRRTYEVTHRGLEMLESHRDEWRTLVGGMEAVLQEVNLR